MLQFFWFRTCRKIWSGFQRRSLFNSKFARKHLSPDISGASRHIKLIPRRGKCRVKVFTNFLASSYSTAPCTARVRPQSAASSETSQFKALFSCFGAMPDQMDRESPSSRFRVPELLGRCHCRSPRVPRDSKCRRDLHPLINRPERVMGEPDIHFGNRWKRSNGG